MMIHFHELGPRILKNLCLTALKMDRVICAHIIFIKLFTSFEKLLKSAKLIHSLLSCASCKWNFKLGNIKQQKSYVKYFQLLQKNHRAIKMLTKLKAQDYMRRKDPNQSHSESVHEDCQYSVYQHTRFVRIWNTLWEHYEIFCLVRGLCK